MNNLIEDIPQNTMKRTVLLFGIVLGTILSVHMVYVVNLLYNNPNFQSNHILGYAFMALAFSLTIFGIRHYRNRQSGKTISFGKAFTIGALIALVGSTMYVVTWLFYYYLIVPDFLDHYIAHVLDEASRGGATASELAARSGEMDQFREMYQSPFFVVLISYMEVLPIGLLVSLVGAVVLKKKPKKTPQ